MIEGTDATHFFELVIAMFLAIIALYYVAQRLGLPPSAGLLAGGAALTFLPGVPIVKIDPGVVLVVFLPPLLMDGAWSIAVSRLRKHLVGIGSLAVGAVFFTCAVVAWVTHQLFPALPLAACAVLGAIVAPPDAVAARAVLEHVRLPRRLQILLEGESLLNDASGLVLFRFAIAASVTGVFTMSGVGRAFLQLSLGGVLVGIVVGWAWVAIVRRLGDSNLIIAATALLSWSSYLLGEAAHVSGVFATVTAGLIASWHQSTVLSALTRLRGTAFWGVMVFLMEAAVFVLIGLSLRSVVERGGGFGVIAVTMGWQILAVLAAITVARFAWVFGSEAVIRLRNALGNRRFVPLGARGATVLGWAGIRGVVTLALALSVPEDFPGRDFILLTAFAVILVTVLLQGMTLGRLIAWAKLSDPDAGKTRLTMSQAEAAAAQVQLAAVQIHAYDGEGKLIHPMLLEQYTKRATAIGRYAEQTEEYKPRIQAHFDVVLEAVAAGRRELIRLHRAGDIDDETLHELERDLDLEELSALSAKS